MNVMAKITDILTLLAVTVFAACMLLGRLYEKVAAVHMYSQLAGFAECVADEGYIGAGRLDKLQKNLWTLDEHCRITELSVNRIMYEPEYVVAKEALVNDDRYVCESIRTELPDVIDEPPVFTYKPEKEAEEYNKAIRARKHVCSICEAGKLCKDIRDFRPLRNEETVIKGSPILQCAVIIYSDGSEKAVTCRIDADSNECCNNRTVTMQYEADGIIFECTYLLDVLPDVEMCLKGHSYYRENVSGLKKCPYCAEYPEYIEISAPHEPLEIEQGSSLASNGVAVKVFFMDGHEEILYSGYSDNLEEGYAGIQMVTVSYRGKSDVIVVNNIAEYHICVTCGRESNHSYGKERGLCETCALELPYFTGTIFNYEKIFYKEEIFKELFSEGKYYLKKGDFFKLEIQTGENEIIVYGTEIRGGAD